MISMSNPIINVVAVICTSGALLMSSACLAAADCTEDARRCLRSYLLWLNDSTAKHLNYEVATHNVNGTVTTDTVQVYSMPGYSLTKAGSYSICTDRRCAVFVEHVTKSVYIVDMTQSSVDAYAPHNVTEQFLRLLFDGECSCTQIDNRIVLVRSFPVPQEYIQGFLANSAQLTLDAKTNRLTSIAMDVDVRTGVKRLDILYLKMETAVDVHQVNPLSTVYDSQGVLRELYRGYTIHNQLR
ncbi:MAG: hypothetical protein J5I53_00575 [Bradyrhizobiaceae bacterium]|nr:hypothetical protein [Bradyrhizobiaceae bacterium]